MSRSGNTTAASPKSTPRSFEVTPETLWRAGCDEGTGYAELAAFVKRCGRPVVGHGVLASIGAATPPARRAAWRQALQRDQQVFGFDWISEHLGFADADGLHVAWPLPLPPAPEAVATVAAALVELQAVHRVVAFERRLTTSPPAHHAARSRATASAASWRRRRSAVRSS